MFESIKPPDVLKTALSLAGLYFLGKIILGCYLVDDIDQFKADHPGEQPLINEKKYPPIIDCKDPSCESSSLYVRPQPYLRIHLPVKFTRFFQSLGR